MVTDQKKLCFLLACIFAISFIVFTYLVFQGIFSSFDQDVSRSLIVETSSLLYIISRILAYLYIPLSFIVFYLFGSFMLNKQKYEALLVLASFSGAIIAELILKPIFQIQCPSAAFGNFFGRAEVFGFLKALQSVGLIETCYPSSHVASYVVLCGYLGYLTLRYIKRQGLKSLILVILLSVIILIGPSRIYLHVHWFSDVVAGYLLGFALLMVILFLHSRFSARK